MGADGPKVIHVFYAPANMEQVYGPHTEVVGDLHLALESLADRLKARLHGSGALLILREGILRRIIDRVDEDHFSSTPQRLVHDARRVMPEGGTVALDTGMYKIWFAWNHRSTVATPQLKAGNEPVALLTAFIASVGASTAASAPCVHKDGSAVRLRTGRPRKTTCSTESVTSVSEVRLGRDIGIRFDRVPLRRMGQRGAPDRATNFAFLEGIAVRADRRPP